MDRATLIQAMDDYCRRAGLKPSTVGQYALRNRRFYDNLVAGRDFQVGTAERLLAWMHDNPPREAAE